MRATHSFRTGSVRTHSGRARSAQVRSASAHPARAKSAVRCAHETVRVRPIRVGDAARLANLCTQLGYPSRAKDVARRSAEKPSLGGGAVFVAESRDGEVVGWVQVCVRTILVSDRHAEVEGLVVDECWRGQGVGGTLMKHAEQWARRAGCKAVSLRSNVIRKEARPFYESIGYKVVKTQWAFRKQLKE